ncbi:hypothetical protein ACFV1W_35790 [Kitasatospora sp. NPDC059648]|uniref:hypothetical protein n=1 Tax=Kitasatospora sp. NPDC059648 TaxID=3346894 RepID=UPI0036786592
MDEVTVRPVARVVGGREEVRDDGWGSVAAAGTPVLDVKPYLAEFGPRGEVRRPAWSTELVHAYYEGGVER